MARINAVLLIDDDYATNLYHKIVIEESGYVDKVIVKNSAEEALEYFKADFSEEHPKPDLVFLDINMPRMTGWDFLDAYAQLPADDRADHVIVMLSTSSHPDDLQRADDNPHVCEYRSKPLTEVMLDQLISQYCELEA